MTQSPVYLTRCGSYDIPLLTDVLRQAFDALGVGEEFFRGKRVLLKPNLVLAKRPEGGATTHPAMLSALANVLFEWGAASVTLADSPGGPFNASALAHVYKVCGMEEVDPRVKRNDDFTFRPVSTDGVKLKNFRVISAALDADVIVDVCKLKSHCLTGMSCAVKNLFGLIPGLEKFEMHSAFPELPEFAKMLVDLAAYVTSTKPFLAICDGILSMEGNGPTHGTPVKTDLLLVSRDPFALDVVAEHVMKRDGEILYLDRAAERGLVPRDWREIPILGLPEPPTVTLAYPDADAGHFLKSLPGFMGGRFAKSFEPRPKIDAKRCIGCGKCAASCPRSTIRMTPRGKRRVAQINRKNCIRCWCCQELCPIGAVNVWQNPLIKLIH